MSETKVSNSQLEVWEWKEKLWKEVAHLDRKSAVSKMLKDSLEIEKQFKPGEKIKK